MPTSCTVATKHETAFEWAIKNFSDYLRVHQKVDPNYILCSEKFSSSNNNFVFRLLLNFQDVSSNDHLALRLHPCRYKNKSSIIKYFFYILNKNNYMVNVLKFSTNYEEAVRDNYVIFYKKSDLVKNSLLPNDTLTIGCDFVIYDKPVPVLSVYKKNNNFTMKEEFKNLLKNQTDCDITFIVDKEEIHAHTFILSARPEFERIIRRNMIGENNNRVQINNMCPNIFRIMLEFIYTDEVQVYLNENEVLELFAAADKYMLHNLKEICAELLFIKLTPENAVRILLFAEKYSNDKLALSIQEFIKGNSAEITDIICPDHFLQNPHHASMFIFEKSS